MKHCRLKYKKVYLELDPAVGADADALDSAGALVDTFWAAGVAVAVVTLLLGLEGAEDAEDKGVGLLLLLGPCSVGFEAWRLDDEAELGMEFVLGGSRGPRARDGLPEYISVKYVIYYYYTSWRLPNAESY